MTPDEADIRGTIARTHERLLLLVRAGELFHQSLNLEETLTNIARMAVESFAGLCLFDLIDEQSDRLYVTAAAHADRSLEPLVKQMGSAILYEGGPRVHPAVHVAQTGASLYFPVLDEASIIRHAISNEHAEFMRLMGYRSKIVVPVVAHSHFFGALTFVRTAGAAAFERGDVQAAEELGRRAGLAVANAKQFRREQQVAAALQSAFLPNRLPNRPGVTVHALYRPSDNEAELGGDWYDAFDAEDGHVVITIGDVVGSGIAAARSMGQLRQSVRVAATITREPGQILDIVNRALMLDDSDVIATAFVGVIDQQNLRLRSASAGHPPVFLRHWNSRVEALPIGDPPLGVGEIRYHTSETRLDGVELIALYTDGVTEIERDPITGEARLTALLASDAIVHAANPARFLERALAHAPVRDDVAIMTVRFGANDRQWRFDVGDSAAAYTIKRELIAALQNLVPIEREHSVSCELILSELIGNAVRYAPGPLSLTLSLRDGQPELHLIDEGPGFDYRPTTPTDVWAESGRGLFLISQLARHIEVCRLPGYGAYVRVALSAGEVEPAVA